MIVDIAVVACVSWQRKLFNFLFAIQRTYIFGIISFFLGIAFLQAHRLVTIRIHEIRRRQTDLQSS